MRGELRKLNAKLAPNGEVSYQFAFKGGQGSDLRDLIGSLIKFSYTSEIYCCHCGRATKKSFSQGYCYPCFTRLAACDLCMMKPETCHFYQGTCREPEWAQNHCMQEHVVYLAYTSGYKVGITRRTQVPTRWIDQGAVAAIPLFSVPTRRDSGLIEDVLKSVVADKTHWQRMLKTSACPEESDLLNEARTLQDLAHSGLESLDLDVETVYAQPINAHTIQRLVYPLMTQPPTLKSLSFDKTPIIEGILLGAKGQYLVLDQGVLNIRKHTSYVVQVEYGMSVE